jgi:hypothetical protein
MHRTTPNEGLNTLSFESLASLRAFLETQPENTPKVEDEKKTEPVAEEQKLSPADPEDELLEKALADADPVDSAAPSPFLSPVPSPSLSGISNTPNPPPLNLKG